ncbi:MAG: VTT domain-containing protein [Candidatus Pacearchaeota archaeon]
MVVLKNQIRILLAAILVVIVFLFSISFIFRDEFISLVILGIDDTGIVMIFVLTVILEIVPQYIAPHILLISAMILGMNMYYVLAALLLGSIMGSLIGYELGRVYGTSLVQKMVSQKKMEKTSYFVNKHGAWFILVTSFSPVPYLPIVFGSLNMKRRVFLFFGLIPRMIGFVIFTFLLSVL